MYACTREPITTQCRFIQTMLLEDGLEHLQAFTGALVDVNTH